MVDRRAVVATLEGYRGPQVQGHPRHTGCASFSQSRVRHAIDPCILRLGSSIQSLPGCTQMQSVPVSKPYVEQCEAGSLITLASSAGRLANGN